MEQPVLSKALLSTSVKQKLMRLQVARSRRQGAPLLARERLVIEVVAPLAALLAESRRGRREPVTAALRREFSSPVGNPAHAKT
jgi:hypothetical protein